MIGGYKLNVGDIVSRKSYNNDIAFKIININERVCYLKGVNNRLYADSDIDDLVKCDCDIDCDNEFIERIKCVNRLERDDYFYLPGKIMHIDGDIDYLNRCLKYYEEVNLAAIGMNIKEKDIALKMKDLLETYKPNIVVITGHDAYYSKKGSINDIDAYRNSKNFIDAVKKAREYESSQDKLVIIAGACQSDYEELIKAGANFASSPKRINIHALDPAIVASKMSISNKNEEIDLKNIISLTKYGSEGIGGIMTKGTMYKGYPR